MKSIIIITIYYINEEEEYQYINIIYYHLQLINTKKSYKR